MKNNKLLWLMVVMGLSFSNILTGCAQLDSQQPVLNAQPYQVDDNADEADIDADIDTDAEQIKENTADADIVESTSDDVIDDSPSRDDSLEESLPEGEASQEDTQDEASTDENSSDEGSDDVEKASADYRISITSYVRDKGEADYHEEKSYENQKIAQGSMIAMKLGGQPVYCVATGCNADSLSLMFSGKCIELDKDSLEQIGGEEQVFSVNKDDSIIIKPLDTKSDAYFEIYYACSVNDENADDKKESEDGKKQISQYVDYYKKIISAAYISSTTGVDAPDGQYSHIFAEKAADKDCEFGYLIADFDKDGREELFLGENGNDANPGPVYDIYTFDDKDMILHIYSSGEGECIYFTDSGVLMNGSSTNTAAGDYYIIEDGMLSRADIFKKIKKVNIEFHELRRF